MLKLNLISEKNKKEIILKRVYFLIRRVGFILAIFIFFLSAIFSGASFIAQKVLQEYVSSSEFYEDKEQELNNEKIISINEKIDTATTVQKDFFPFSVLIKNLSDLITAGISLEGAQIDINKKFLKISGIADSRENFLVFKKTLESSDLFAEVDSPLTSILQKENIEFEITMKINLNKFFEL
jgi:hypothetical protein